MGRINRLSDVKSINVEDYCNLKTGELLSSEVKVGAKAQVSELSGKFEVVSDDFVTIDKKAFDYLSEILNISDMGRIIKMSLCLRTPLNIIYNTNNFPHDSSSLQKYLEIKSQPMFSIFINKLVSNGVLYKLKGLINNHVKTVYIMNPFLCKKRRIFAKELEDIFVRFNKKKELPKGSEEFNNN